MQIKYVKEEANGRYSCNETIIYFSPADRDGRYALIPYNIDGRFIRQIEKESMMLMKSMALMNTGKTYFQAAAKTPMQREIVCSRTRMEK